MTSAEQKQGKKARSGAHLAHWQSAASERQLQLGAAHAVPHTTVTENPILKNYGGKRNCSKGWTEAAHELATRDSRADEKYETELKNAKKDFQKAQEVANTKKTEAARQQALAAAREKYEATISKAQETRRAVVSPRDDLCGLLLGRSTKRELAGFNGGSWFSEATKVYNSGQSPARKGQISPWVFGVIHYTRLTERSAEDLRDHRLTNVTHG